MLLRLLLKVTKVTNGHQKLQEIGQNSIISSFFCPKELEVGPVSGPHLLVLVKLKICISQAVFV